MSIQRVDPRFVLPRPVERAVVLGGLDPWVDGLREAGIEASELLAADDSPELAVAPVELAADAVFSGAEMIVLEGRGGETPLRRAGFYVQRLIPIPSIAEPRYLVPADHRHAAVYAVEHGSIPTTLSRRLRNALVKSLLAHGRFPDLVPAFTVGLRSEGSPFFLVAAEELGLPRRGEWFLSLGGYDALSRSVFHVFAPGEAEPGWVVKFARVPGYTDSFEGDERGHRLVASAGDVVGKHVPRVLGRVEINGFHASVEIAAAGYCLTDFLQRKISRDEKLRVIDSVAAWIVELGKSTVRNPSTLQVERDRLESDVLPHWSEFGASPSLVQQVADVPSVLQHANVGAWNVVARGPDDFAVVDWESVREHGLPLWDLIVFLTDALLKLDGAFTEGLRDQHTIRLFRGELPSSETLFRWLRRAVQSLDLPAAAVGPITTLCWLDQGAAAASRTASRAALGVGESWVEGHSEHIALLWLGEPGLGSGWDSWRKR